MRIFRKNLKPSKMAMVGLKIKHSRTEGDTLSKKLKTILKIIILGLSLSDSERVRDVLIRSRVFMRELLRMFMKLMTKYIGKSFLVYGLVMPYSKNSM